MEFSSNGIQQLKEYFSNNNDSNIFVPFVLLLYLCSTPAMFSTKYKIKISYKSQNATFIPNMVTNNDVNINFAVFVLEFLFSFYRF